MENSIEFARNFVKDSITSACPDLANGHINGLCDMLEVTQDGLKIANEGIDILSSANADLETSLAKSRAGEKRLVAALLYSIKYLNESKLNSIGSGSKAHIEMRDALIFSQTS